MRSSALYYRGAIRIRARHHAAATCSVICGDISAVSSSAVAAAHRHHAPQIIHRRHHEYRRQEAFEAKPSIRSNNEISSRSFSSQLQKTDDSSSSSSSSSSSTEVSTTNYLPIDLETCAKIEGEESHIVTIELQPGECIRAESGSMVYMTESIKMNTTLGAGAASGAMKRMLTGQNVFLTDFTCEPSSADDDNTQQGEKSIGQICLGTDFPSKIIRLNLQDMANETLICQRGAYLASNPTVDIDMEFTKSLSAGFFGGQGFILQRLSGQGDVLIKAGGTLVAKELLPGETLRVTSGSIVAFENTIDYDIQMMPGIKNAMFGGEGLFVTKLTGGPNGGRVWLQGLPPDRMISEIARRVPGPGIGLGIPIGMGGGGGGGGADESAGAEETGGEGGGEDVSEQVAATDSAIDADRQATVASSGMMGDSEAVDDPNSPSALFGDAAPEKDVGGPSGDDASFTTDSTETTFGMDDESFTTESTLEEPTFDDGSSFSSSEEDFSQQEGEFFGEDPGSTSTDFGGDAATEEGGSSLLETLWDLFMGGDD